MVSFAVDRPVGNHVVRLRDESGNIRGRVDGEWFMHEAAPG